MQGSSVAGEVTYQTTEADYVAANRDWFRRAIVKRKALVRNVVTVLASFALGVVLSQGGKGTLAIGNLYAGLAMSGVVIVAVLLSYAVAYALIPRRAAKLFRQQTTFQKPMKFSWSDYGMVQDSANGTGTYAWRDLHRWTAGREAFMPYVNDQLYFIVPRRVLNEQQAADLLATLERSGLPQG